MTDTAPISIPTELVYLSAMLRDAVVDAKGQSIGTVADVIVRLQPDAYPPVTGLVMRVGQSQVFVSIDDVTSIESNKVELGTARLDLRPFERRDGEVLLKGAVLGHRLIDVEHARLVRAYDVALTEGPTGWIACGLDVHPHRRFGVHRNHPVRDWKRFEALIGHQPSGRVRSGFGRLRRLRPAQIADLIENASAKERDDLLDHLHHHPELEADVFEELDDDRQTQVLKSRSTEEITGLLSRMRTDDAVDALLDLPQDRRQPVLDALPEPQHADVLRLMGYQDSTAGGLMGVDYIAISEHSTVQQALQILRAASNQQPEALTVIYTIDVDNRLLGSLSLVRAVQADPLAQLHDIADKDPVHAEPQDDIIDVANLMADFNLLALPILDGHGRILGVVTVDDALEAAIPEDWRRRERRQQRTNRAETSA